jgi:hypothetical protein
MASGQRGYQRHEKNECQPYAAAARGARRQPIDKKFDAVLGAYRTSNRCNNRGQDNDMRCKPLTAKGRFAYPKRLMRPAKPVGGKR